MTTYEAIGKYGGETIFIWKIEAETRAMAVNTALQRFWEEFGKNPSKKYAAANEIVTVSDPHNEVTFNDDFNCNDKKNNYLDEPTIARVLEQSKGVLLRDTRDNVPNHPRRTFCRNKRRRVFLETVAPNIMRSPTSGVLYYRTIEAPQKSKGGVISQKRKMQNVRLEAKTVLEAIVEIKAKGLRSRTKKNSRRKMPERSLHLLEHLAGGRKLKGPDAEFYAPALRRLESTEPVKPVD